MNVNPLQARYNGHWQAKYNIIKTLHAESSPYVVFAE